MKTTFLTSAFMIAMATSFQSFAVETPPAAVNMPSPKAEVVYNGVQGDMLVFQLKIANATKGRSFLSIRNEAGDELYSSTYQDQNVVQIIKIPSSEQKQLHFMINGNTLQYSKRFVVDTHYTESIEVKESK